MLIIFLSFIFEENLKLYVKILDIVNTLAVVYILTYSQMFGVLS